MNLIVGRIDNSLLVYSKMCNFELSSKLFELLGARKAASGIKFIY